MRMKRLQDAARRSTAMLPRTSDGQNGAVAVRGNEYMLEADGVDVALDCRRGVWCLLTLQEVPGPPDDGRMGRACHARRRSPNVRMWRQ